jgi:tetratricopeptide (TPR) repeat protein
MEELAKLEKSPDIWYKTGERYMDISDLVEITDRGALLTKAEDCFNNALKIDSNNLDAKVGIGACIVEQGDNPMMGIKMITEVINKDSDNEPAQIALGRFSIKSAQFARAVYRFHRVMEIDASFHEGYLYLAQAYEGMGNKKEAIVNLKKYRNFAPDSTIKSQIDKHILEDLKGDTIN